MTVVERDNYDPDQPAWIFPDLAGVKQSGTKLGSFISAKVGKVELPEKPVDGGIRPGACNTLLKYMPAELAVYTTGHEMKGVLSSFFEYIDAELAKCMPGAIVLAGWPALPWGQFGDGPTPASLDVLVKEHAVPMEALEAAITATFHLHKRSPPSMHVGNALRPLVHCAFATMLMHHDARRQAGEMHEACQQLEDVVNQKFACGALGNAQELIKKWGRSIEAQFTKGNLHLPTRAWLTSPTF